MAADDPISAVLVNDMLPLKLTQSRLWRRPDEVELIVAGLIVVVAIAVAFAWRFGRPALPIVCLCTFCGVLVIAGDRSAVAPASEHAAEANTGQRTLVVGPRDTGSTEYVVRLAGHRFVVPANILDSILIESPVVEGELNQGFSMIALLPGFDGRSEANLQQFLVGSTQVNRVRISLTRTCPPPPLPYECSVPVRASQALDSQWGDLIQSDEIAPEVPGLARFGQLVQPSPGAPNAPAGEVRSDVFDVEAPVENGGNKRVEFITCDALGAVPVLHCHHLFAWRNDIWVQLSYKRENLQDWKSIKARAVQTLSGFADAAPGAAETTVHFP